MRLVDATIDDLLAALRPLVRSEIESVLQERLGPSRPFVTLQQAAERFSVEPHVIRDATRRGELVGLRVGRQWRFRVSDLDEWAERCARESRRLA